MSFKCKKNDPHAVTGGTCCQLVLCIGGNITPISFFFKLLQAQLHSGTVYVELYTDAADRAKDNGSIKTTN